MAKRRERDETEAREVAAKLAKRQAVRTSLRLGLIPIAADVIDQIEELDLQRTPELAATLIETAKLAPEAFPPTVIEYVFSLLESQEHWFDKVGITALAELNAEPKRLARCAMVCLQHGYATHAAAQVLVSHLDTAEESLIPKILPSIIQMAAPPRRDFDSDQAPNITPLLRVSEAFPHQVLATFGNLLDQGPAYVGLASRGLKVLTHQFPAMAVQFARDLIGKLVRAPWMPDPDDYGGEYNDVAADLSDTIVKMFLLEPDMTDKLLQSFCLGASEEGKVRIFSIYSQVLRTGRRFQSPRPVGPADRLAFRRLLWEASKTSSDKILREIEGAISDAPNDQITLAKDEVDALLGSAILMGDKVTALDAEVTTPKATSLDIMERNNRRAFLAKLRDNFVSWAAAGASASGEPDAYLKVLNGLPEDRDEMAASMIRSLAAMTNTAEGLNAILPSLFSALVGPSVIKRGSAAETIGDIPTRQRDNAPDLLLEAFTSGLTDPYIYVHQSAVKALRSMRLPPRFDTEIRTALSKLLIAYSGTDRGMDITLECIDLLVRRYLTDTQLSGEVGAFVVKELAKIPSWRLSREIAHLTVHLAHARGMTEMIVKILYDPETTEYGVEDAVEALERLPVDVIYTNREKLAEAFPTGTKHMPEYWVLEVVQILGRSSAWAEAERLCAAALAAIPDTVREAPRRRIYQLTHAAVSFESALANGDESQALILAERWRQLEEKKDK